MSSDSAKSLFVHDNERLHIAQQIVAYKQQQLGDHLRAAACYGSVAHHAASEYSDVEMVLLTDDTIPAREEQFFVHGIMVECDMLSTSRMLSEAQRVSKRWGLETDQYRHHLVLLDHDNFFPHLWEAARNIAETSFAEVLPVAWWWCYESRNKLRNALSAQDGPRICSEGWTFATAVAMHIALRERRPYESGRTIWQDIASRGYSMQGLIDILVTRSLEQMLVAVDVVWQQISQWGVPEEVGMKYQEDIER